MMSLGKLMSMRHRISRRLLAEIATWSHKGGSFRRGFYYRVLSPGFKGEQQAVGAGISSYLDKVESVPDLYRLRRNIHRLEKGLTMRPRRDKFAMDYIEGTIADFRQSVGSSHANDWVSSEEYKWMSSVLHDYFAQTRPSKEPLLIRMEREFQEALAMASDVEVHGLGPHAPYMSASSVPVESLHELAHNRRSIRWFKKQAVPRAIVEKAVEVGIEAPTACNRQPYRFEIFDDPESVSQVAGVPMGTAGYAHQIPGIIVVIGDLSAFFDERDRHLIYIDSSLATMGLILGLESQEVASCVINWPDMPDRERTMRDLLGLKMHERVIMLIAYGYADERGLTPYSAKRRPTEALRFRQLNEILVGGSR